MAYANAETCLCLNLKVLCIFLKNLNNVMKKNKEATQINSKGAFSDETIC